MYNCPPKRKQAKFGAGNSKKRVFLRLFGNLPFWRAIFGRIWSNPSCAWISALNRHFLAISLFIAADLPSWWYLCLIVWICCFLRNLFALCMPVVLICLMCFASFHPFGSIENCCLRFENRVFESLVCCQNPMCDLLDFRCAC